MPEKWPDERLIGDVLSHYPLPLHRGLLVPLGNRGGFSGARLWRLDGTHGSACLRLWPPETTLPLRLPWIHERMRQARSEGLLFVPALLLTTQGQSWVQQGGRCWEVTQWMPGRANYHSRPSSARLHEACKDLARLHLCWARTPGPRGICPGVVRRLESHRQWAERMRSGWTPGLVGDTAIHQAWRMLVRFLDRVPSWLLPWTTVDWPLQPCLCDVWHDHLFFEGDQLTGLVDYGAVKMDHPAVDLGRLLGSLVEDDAGRWQEGLQAYREVKPLSAEEEELARVLDKTGIVLGLANWLRWLLIEKRSFENPAGAMGRLERLVKRIERWS
jgi:Ser/Thr protein kinase RdoA (MazF antagonist)